MSILNRDNYDSWKLRIQAIMIENSTWHYENRIYLKLQDDAADLADYKKEDKKTKNYFYLAVSLVMPNWSKTKSVLRLKIFRWRQKTYFNIKEPITFDKAN